MQYRFEGCSLDLRRGCLFNRAAQQVELRPKSFEVLRYLVENAGCLVTKQELIASIWQQAVVSDESISRCISDARTAIDDPDHKVIKTVPRRGYLFTAAVTRQVEQEPVSSGSVGVVRTIPDKPSIAVLAFANMSGDPAQEYVSDGITDDIITELSRFAELFVVARNSSFQYKGKAVDVRQVGQELGVRYILEGSLRRSDNRLRITAQLIDTATGAHRWAERYDREAADVFAVQDEVAHAVAAVLVAHVRNAEAERTALKPPATWQAYDYYLRAVHALNSFWTSYKVDEFWEARRLAERSILVDPGYAGGHALLSSTYVVAWLSSFGTDPVDNSPLDRSFELAARAVQLDGNLPQARAQLGNVLSWQAQHEAGIAEFEKAAELNPNFADWRYAIALILGGQAATALDVARDYFRRDPFAPGSAYLWVGTANYLLKNYSEAVAVLRQCVSRMPNARFIHSWLAAAYAQLDDVTRARFHAAEVLRIEPRFTIRKMSKTFLALKSPADAQHVLDGLRKAGLPEG